MAHVADRFEQAAAVEPVRCTKALVEPPLPVRTQSDEERITIPRPQYAHGFVRVHGMDCGHDRRVPFACKRRGFSLRASPLIGPSDRSRPASPIADKGALGEPGSGLEQPPTQQGARQRDLSAASGAAPSACRAAARPWAPAASRQRGGCHGGSSPRSHAGAGPARPREPAQSPTLSAASRARTLKVTKEGRIASGGGLQVQLSSSVSTQLAASE